ncbi:TPA: response regulator transcription factor [Escherichia coli]|nr:LuxR family transcriptional regulator [Escherichia coli]MXG64089.1 LuxR family transcriptional regulator [Escherichia coli]HBB9787922.1 response regulator transcription factor [Escherichia coli]
MINRKTTCYVKEYDVTVHIWILSALTDAECEVFELLLKGYTITRISRSRTRSIKTVSLQKQQIYNKLNIRSDITFWLDLSLSPHIKMNFSLKNTAFRESLLPDVNHFLYSERHQK